jgi:predicted transcriptional regulator
VISPRRYGWCISCNKYRANQYIIDDKFLCDYCHTSPRFKSLPILDERPKLQRKNDITKKQNVGRKYDQLIINEILRLLVDNDPMNRDDIFDAIIVDFYKSKKRVNSIILSLKRKNLIISEKKNRNARAYYTLPEKRSILISVLNRVYYQEFLNYVCDDWVSIDALGVNRSKCTLYRWVEMYKEAGLIEVKITSLPNKKGYYKFIKKK